MNSNNENISQDLKRLGFDRWFLDRTDLSIHPDSQIARVTSVNKESFLVRNRQTDAIAELTGKMLFNADSPVDFPTVGDWVIAQFYDNDTFAVIHEIIPRKSFLKRKTPGKRIDCQLIAANIDTAFITQSLDSDYNLRRLERYLVMINEGNIRPVVLLSKSDLLTAPERDDIIGEIQALMPDIQIIDFSNLTGHGLDRIKTLVASEKTFCMLGSSGVGKTTLLNNLTDGDVFETNTVREKDGKGKHTTTRRQLICLKNDAMIIDTPGMRELGNITASKGLDETFSEIRALAEQCFYKNCTHTNEKGCAIIQALKDGVISKNRYRNFEKLNKEIVYNDMSYVDKKRKDKQFSKLCKTVLKDKQTIR